MSEAENMAIKISKRIVDYKIQKDDEPTAASAAPQVPEKETMHEDIERPEELRGYTYKIKTPLTDHALYITINNIVLNRGTEDEQEYPFEIFINSKNMEHFAWTVALTRMISAVFRRGGNISFVVEELKAVFDPRGGQWMQGKYVPSLLAALGGVIETHLIDIGFLKSPGELADPSAAEAQIVAIGGGVQAVDGFEGQGSSPSSIFRQCPKCGQPNLIRQEGCDTCTSCGYSRCG